MRFSVYDPSSVLGLMHPKELTILIMGSGPSARISHKISSHSQAECYAPLPILRLQISLPLPPLPPFRNPAQPTSPFPLTPLSRTLEDRSQEQVNFCILAMGYQVNFPFFNQGIEPFLPESDPPQFYLPKCFPPWLLTPI